MKLTLILGALAAAALVLQINRSASGPDIRTDRSTQIERAPQPASSDAPSIPATPAPAGTPGEVRIVPPVKRVAPKSPDEPQAGAKKTGTDKGAD